MTGDVSGIERLQKDIELRNTADGFDAILGKPRTPESSAAVGAAVLAAADRNGIDEVEAFESATELAKLGLDRQRIIEAIGPTLELASHLCTDPSQTASYLGETASLYGQTVGYVSQLTQWVVEDPHVLTEEWFGPITHVASVTISDDRLSLDGVLFAMVSRARAGYRPRDAADDLLEHYKGDPHE